MRHCSVSLAAGVWLNLVAPGKNLSARTMKPKALAVDRRPYEVATEIGIAYMMIQYHAVAGGSALFAPKKCYPKKESGESMDLDTIMDSLSKELLLALKAMSKAKDVNTKEAHSRVVKNLCDSLGVFLGLASEMIPYEFDDPEDPDMPF